ncbi:MAG: radical SAM protein [Actinobacteria bacterium]|nr:MAG: radical SAM protein [Actinomycetota bacterium]
MIKYRRLFTGGICNNDCVLCPVTSERAGYSLGQILDEMGSPEGSVDSLELYGGEPALRQDLTDLIGEAKQRGWRRVKMTTNARAFADPQAVISTMQAGVRVFEVKLLGHVPQLHDALTQSPGSFMETIQGLSNLHNVQVPKEVKTFVGVRVGVGAVNYPYLPQIVSFIMQVGADRVTLSLDDPQAHMSDVAASLKAAIDTGLVNSTWVQTEGVPPCLMGGYEHHVHESFGIVEGERERCEPCAACAYSTCAGIAPAYLEANGSSEFVAVLSSVHAKRMKEAAG